MTLISMTDVDTWPAKLAVYVYGRGFLIISGCLLARVYISRKFLGEILRAFRRSPEAEMWESILDRGVFGRVLLMSMLANLMLLSRRHIRRGEVSAQDVREFPDELKKVLWIDGILMGFAAAIFIGLCVLLEFRGSA